MKRFLFIGSVILAALYSKAQTPSTCFEIESILVDACGSPEGENEMVRFVVGPSALNTSALTINWPNNPYLGICQNATTAAAVASLNSTIQGCGYLIEPVAGVLPAGAKVLLITSTNVDVTANSFTNLNDTLIVIFQCAGNTQGHFANYNSSSGIRTLSMSFGSGCSDQVSYDRSLLINQNGTYGGSSAIKDGARVDFDWSGNATYANDGCQAPITPSLLAINNSDTTICPGATFSLSASQSNDIISIKWESTSGGNFSNNSSSPTNYSNNNTNDQIILTGYTTCGDSLKDTLSVTIATPINVQITSNTNDTICNGQTATLTASGASSYQWNNGSNSNAISVSTTGDYTVIGSTTCYSDTATFHIEVILPPTISVSTTNDTICNGQSTTLNAISSQSPIVWNTGQTSNSITATTQGWFTASVTNIYCGTVSDSAYITVITAPTLSLQTTDSSLCTGAVTITANASNFDNLLWNTGDNTNQITVADSGWYTVTVSNNCFNTSDSLYIYPAIMPIAQILTTDTILCNNEAIILTASPANNVNYLWNTGETGNQITTSSAQTYSVIVSNSCGSDTAYQTIYDQSVIADFITSTDFGEAPLDVDFTNLSQNADTYTWLINGQTTSNQTNFSNTFNEEGIYTVTLIAQNNFGCIDSTWHEINVTLMTTIYIPNVFTPNGDGINDVFLIKGNNIRDYTFKIFNRWGKLIFEGDETMVWDGTYNGELVPDGSYAYIVKVRYNNDVNDIITGNIQKLK